MDVNTWARDLWINVLGSAVWTTMVMLAGLTWYVLRTRRREKGWIRNHGLMLLVYFRNVDGRCEKLRHLIGESPARIPQQKVSDLADELQKLEADLDALDRIASLWARRGERLPFWYPYASTIRELLEAQVELQVALMRHVSPLRHALHQERATTECGDFIPGKGYVGYAEYFCGCRDRLWGNPSSSVPAGAAELAAVREWRLRDRLEAVLGPLREVLDLTGGVEVERLRIWGAQERPNGVWFLSEGGTARA